MAALRALVVLAAAVIACGEDPTRAGTTPLPAGPAGMPPPDQVVENGQHLITVEGVKKALLTGEQLYFYNESGKVLGDTIEVSFFDDAGAFVSRLTAKTGEMDQASQEMIARGDVFVTGRDATIRTEVLRYDPRANRITSDAPTVINQQGNVIRGRGVESDPALRDIRIRGGSAVLRSEPDLGPRPAARDTVAPPRDETAAPADSER